MQLKIAEDEEKAEVERLKQLEAEAAKEAAEAVEAERLAGKCSVRCRVLRSAEISQGERSHKDHAVVDCSNQT